MQMTDRPQSATSLLTGLVGAIAAVLAIYAVSNPDIPLHVKALVIVASTAGAMIIVEVVFFKVYLNPSTGLASAPLRPLSVERTFRKLVGFITTLCALAAGYWVLAEYQDSFYAPYWAALKLCMPWLLVLAPFYVAYVDRRQTEPEDAYAALGAIIMYGRPIADIRAVWLHILGWIVKAFFLPLMFVYLCSSLTTFLSAVSGDGPSGIVDWHRLGIDLFFLYDVIFAAAGYSLTLRILDTHIRTVEPTAFGWIVCLICYQPFYSVTFSYLAFSDQGRWQAALPEGYLLQSLWGFAILFCLFIYAWSTVCFGLRFSNLTHRGVITSGPYRWMKHPAYVSKNMSWWLISVPFLGQASYAEAIRHSILLLSVNGIYLLRAMTEERHLSWDRDYVAYKDFIRREGLWARILNLFGRRPAASGGL